MVGHQRAVQSAIFLALLASVPALGARSPASIQVKPGGNYETRVADLKHCEAVASAADSLDLPPGDRPVGYSMGYAGGAGGGIGATAGVAIAGIIIGLIEESEARGRGEQLCMFNLGYRLLPLSEVESAVYTKLGIAKRHDWERAFLDSDLTERIKANDPPPRVPRLPDYRDGPMRSGGLEFSGLSLAAPVVRQGDDVVKGSVTRWRTAVLVEPISPGDGPVGVEADTGTVFHQVDYRRQRDPLLRLDGATWCGPVKQVANGIKAKDFYCFTGRADGYEVFRPSGQPWLAGPYLGGFSLPLYTKPIKLEERANDDLGVLDFRIQIVEVTRNHVQIAGDVLRGGKQVRLWLREFSWGKTGKAVLPLWDKRLVLTKAADNTVKADLTADGDGRDWRASDGTLLY